MFCHISKSLSGYTNFLDAILQGAPTIYIIIIIPIEAWKWNFPPLLGNYDKTDRQTDRPINQQTDELIGHGEVLLPIMEYHLNHSCKWSPSK